MEPDAWSQKSIVSLWVMPLVALAMSGLILISNLSVYRTKLQVSIENPALSYAQHRIYRRLMGHMLGFVNLIMTIMILVFQPMILNVWIPDTRTLMLAILLPTILIMIPAIWLPLKAGQSGNRLHPVVTTADEISAGYPVAAQSRSLPHAGRDDDRFWFLGLFYYNPDDPGLLIEDRFGSNSGFNYARTVAKILMALLVLVILITYIGSTILFIKIA